MLIVVLMLNSTIYKLETDLKIFKDFPINYYIYQSDLIESFQVNVLHRKNALKVLIICSIIHEYVVTVELSSCNG